VPSAAVETLDRFTQSAVNRARAQVVLADSLKQRAGYREPPIPMRGASHRIAKEMPGCDVIADAPSARPRRVNTGGESADARSDVPRDACGGSDASERW
jgi:hypothetical protein